MRFVTNAARKASIASSLRPALSSQQASMYGSIGSPGFASTSWRVRSAASA
jgi:hypothetical protein